MNSNKENKNKSILKDDKKKETEELNNAYTKLMSKAEKIIIKNNEENKDKKYNFFKIKNIIKENLKEQVKENPYQKERYNEYLNEENEVFNDNNTDVENNYINKEDKTETNEFESIIYSNKLKNNNALKNSTDERVSEINNMEISLLNQAKALGNFRNKVYP